MYWITLERLGKHVRARGNTWMTWTVESLQVG